MATAKNGDRVLVRYTGKFEDGTVFDSSEDCECDSDSGPLEFVLGEHQVIPGFEEAVVGMAPGEEKTVNIPFDKGYGPRSDAMIAEIDRKDLPEEISPTVGERLQVTQEGGATFDVFISALTEDKVSLDGNHPLACRDLVFEIRLEKIL
jgi:peptidylprolyl isomerase